MKKTTLLTSGLIVLFSAAAFFAGAILSKQETIKAFSVKVYRMNILNDVYFYSEFSRILEAGKSGNTKLAICHSQKNAVILRNKIGECLKDVDCKESIRDNTSLLAPELLSESKPRMQASSDQACN